MFTTSNVNGKIFKNENKFRGKTFWAKYNVLNRVVEISEFVAGFA